MPDYSQFTPEELISLCAWREGRGEIAFAKSILPVRAIMHVIKNRVRNWNWSLEHVILGPNQFTSMSVPSDPEFNLLPASDDPEYKEILAVAGSVISGSDVDPSLQACWYANLKNIQPGGWFERHIVKEPGLHPVTTVICHHTFFR